MSLWGALGSQAAAPQQSPGPWGHQEGRARTPTCRTVAGGVRASPCPHVWLARPQTCTGVLVKIPASMLTSLPHGGGGQKSQIKVRWIPSPVRARFPGGRCPHLAVRSQGQARCQLTRTPPASCSHYPITSPSRPPLTPPTLRGPPQRVYRRNLGRT